MFWYHDLVEDASDNFPCEMFDAETPLFILYTSGSTGKPKGVLHTSGGYLLYAAMTHKYTLIIKRETSIGVLLMLAGLQDTLILSMARLQMAELR